MKKIIQGKYYNIEFLSSFKKKGPYFVQISAIAKKETLSYYGDFDIRSTFFDTVGIATYLKMVADTVPIYICHKIKSVDPIEVDTKDFVFIPESIIDFLETEEYKITKKFNINITGIRRKFENLTTRKAFLDKINEEVPKAVTSLDILANDILSLATIESEILVSENVILKETTERENIVNERKAQILTQRKYIADREMDYYDRIKKLEADELEVENLKKSYTALKRDAELNKLNSLEFVTKIDIIKDRISDVYTKIYNKASESGISMPTWIVLNDLMSYSQEEWQDALDNIK